MKTFNRHLILIVVISSLCACGKSESEAIDNNNVDKRFTVALIMKSLANEFFVTMAEGAKAHNVENSEKYELIVNGIKNESDLAQQVSLIDQMVAKGVDAIVIAPADSKAIVPALSRAAEAGVKLVNIDNKLDNQILADYSLTIPFVGPNNREGALMVGEVLSKRLSEGDQVAILEGIPSAFNSQQRRAGFEEAAKQAGLNIVSIQSAGWDQIQAAKITSGLLVQFPDLKAIMCANDSMAMGAVSAIRQAGNRREIKVVGFDNIPAVSSLLKDGGIIATADQHADKLAVFGIEYVLHALERNTYLEDLQTEIDLVTDESP
jgi:ribose transport system substrate-binding protein